MSFSRRHSHSRPTLEPVSLHPRAFRRSFTDEVAIDFPSSAAAIEFFRRDAPDDEEAVSATDAEIRVSAREAWSGARIALDVSVPCTCRCCGGRGEVWSDPCAPCAGRGQQVYHQRLTVSVPAGVSHGDRFSFHLRPPSGPRTRVHVRVAVTA